MAELPSGPESIDSARLNRNLGELLNRIAHGESFVITRYGKGVAYLGPIPDPDPRLIEDTPERVRDHIQHRGEQRRAQAEDQPVERSATGSAPAKPQSWKERQPKQSAYDNILHGVVTKKR